jgi:5-oxopent-3-ene-1,2,5-tricarboxylate decarboxylase/2-hydroxyhepta-2,4-diene-1,7-dioate isomerase
MSVLAGPRSELRHLVHGGSTYWATYDSGELRLGDGRVVAEREVTYLPPCQPTKIICIHLNYMSRLYEFTGANKPPATPTYFQKPVTAINSHGGELVRPEGYQYLNYEGEVAAIIGKVTRNVTPDQVWDHIAGFAPGNDVGLQDMRDTDAGSMLRVKGGDGFCPIGPGIVSGIDIRKETLRTYRNGKLSQEGAISEMLFGIDYIIADLARHITLVPGDVVMTGTPANSRPMNVGDLIEVEVTGLGRLSNRVVASPAPRADVGHQPTDTDGVRRVALGNDERLPSKLQHAR